MGRLVSDTGDGRTIVSMAVADATVQAIDAIAKARHSSRSAVMRELLLAGLDQHTNGTPRIATPAAE